MEALQSPEAITETLAFTRWMLEECRYMTDREIQYFMLLYTILYVEWPTRGR